MNLEFLNFKALGGVSTDGNLTITVEDPDLNLQVLSGRLGVRIVENLSAEIRLGFGIANDSSDVYVTDGVIFAALELDTKIKNYYGGYFRIDVPSEHVSPYLLAGATRTKIDVSIGGVSDDYSETSFGYGVGADFGPSDDVRINIEWGKYYDEDDEEISGFKVGMIRSF